MPIIPARLTTLVAAGALLSTILAAPSAQAADEPHPVVNGGFTLVGRGYGHGRGMSQWGSYQQATEGRGWQQIVAFYYPGANLQTRAASTIRVGTYGLTGATARVAAEAGLTVTDGAGQTIALPLADAGVPITSWEVSLPSQTGTATTATLWFRTATARKALRSTVSGKWTFTDTDGSLTAQNASGKNVATYLGRFTGHRSGSGITPVLATTLEDYTRQVVPWENYTNWPVQAQAAQSVAARSYGAWYIAHPRTSLYDICDTTSCQVFGGISKETSQTRDGVAASAGRVLTHNGAVVRSEFSASNGGQIAAGGVPYTSVAADPYEMRLPTSVTTWQGSVSAAKLQARWPQVGTVRRLVVTGRDGRGQWGGRVTALRLEGSLGTASITPSQLSPLVSGWKGNYFTIADGPDALSRDVSGDGRSELLHRDPNGHLMASDASSGTAFAAPRRIGSGWGGFTAVFAGPFTSDRIADLLALDTTGQLKLYPSRGAGWGTATVVGRGLTGVRTPSLAPGLAAGKPAVVAQRTSDGALLRWPVTGGVLAGSPSVVSAAGWAGNQYNLVFAVRDFSGDGIDDVIMRDVNGNLMMARATSTGTLKTPERIGTGWGGFRSIVGVGDMNADGRTDLVARNAAGETRLYPSAPTSPGRFGAPVPLAAALGILVA